MTALPPHQLFVLSSIENLYFFGNVFYISVSLQLEWSNNIKNAYDLDPTLLPYKIFWSQCYVFGFYGFPVSMTGQLYGLFSNIFS